MPGRSPVPGRQRQPVPGRRRRRHERVAHRAPAMPSSASLPGSWSAARRGRVELQRARRPRGRAGSGEEHEADVLEPATDLALARRVQGDAVDRVLRQAADGQRRAPGTAVTAAAVELLHPARRVELQFREGRSRIDTADPERAHIGITCRSDRASNPPQRNLTQRSRARAPACRRGRMADLDATADPAPGSAQTRDTGRMVDDTARDRAICHALKAADEVASRRGPRNTHPLVGRAPPAVPVPATMTSRPRRTFTQLSDQQSRLTAGEAALGLSLDGGK